MIDRIGAWWTLARSQWLVALSRPMSLATGVFTPLMLMAILLLPRLETLTPEQATRTFSGVLLASFWGASLWSGAGIIRRERAQGTLGASVTGRLGVLTVLLGKVSGGVLFDVGIVCLTNVVFVLGAGIRLQVAHPAAFAVGLAAVVVCGVASSLMLAGVLMLSRYAFQLTTAVGTPVLLLGGTIIPLEVLPDWVSWIGQGITLSHLQRFLTSTATTPQWAALGWALVLAAAYAAVGAWSVRVLLRRARKEATLELA